MNFAHSVLLLFVTVAIICCMGTTNGTKCVVNRCPNNETCLQRHVPNQPEYVCECTMPFFHGYDCSKTLNNNVIQTCYGPDCATGSYASPNYLEGNDYPNRERILYLLYIPWATEIHFSFGDPFGVERDADELFVGSGLSVPVDTLGLENQLRPKQYFFDGYGVPEPFTVYNDTAFIYFKSDAAGTSRGFQIFWNATVADPPPTPTEPPTTPTEPPTTPTEPPTTHLMSTESAASATIYQNGMASMAFTSLIVVIISQFFT